MIANRELERMPGRAVPGPQPLPSAALHGHGYCQLTPEELTAARRRPEPISAAFEPIAPSALRHVDDQTIAALGAVRAAIPSIEIDGVRPFADWGIVVASRFLGRCVLASEFQRFDNEGVWGVSPHLIPHHALHSAAGTLSLVLRMQGPSLGLGGGVGAEFEGFVAALSWLTSGMVPGLFLVQTGWSPECAPTRSGEPDRPSLCQALAMAVMPLTEVSAAAPELRLVTSRDAWARRELPLGELARLLDQSTSRPPSRTASIVSRGRTYLRDTGPDRSKPYAGRKANDGPMIQTVACDATGQMRIEVAVQAMQRAMEDDR